MNLAWTAAGAVAGVPVGAVLRGPVFRLSVPAGEPDRAACPRCGAAASGWPAVRRRKCGCWFGPPLALEAVTAIVLAVLRPGQPGPAM